MQSRTRFWIWGVAALVCGLVLRLYFAQQMPWLTGDTLVYGAIAKNWLTTGVYGFATSNGGVVPTLIRLPGYPLFDAVCFRLFGIEHYRAIINMQIVVDLCTCLLMAGLAGRLAGRRAAMTALWLSALCPFTANYTAAPLTETLTIFTITMAFYSFVRWREQGLGWNRWLWVTAGAMGFSILLRPDQGLLPASILPVMLWMQWRSAPRSLRGVLPAVVAAVLIVLPLGPWAWRNWQTFHVVQPLAPRFANDPGEDVPRGFQRWYAAWAIDFNSTEEVYWNYDGSPIDMANIPSRAFDGDTESQKVDALMAKYNDELSSSPELDAQWAELAKARAKAHPLQVYLLVPFARLTDMWLRPRTEMMQVPLEWWQWHNHKRTALFALLYAGLNLGYLLLAAAGVRWWLRRRPLGPIGISMLLFVVLRCLLLMTIDNSEPRYTLECWPMVLVMAAVGWICLSRSGSQQVSESA